MRNRKWLLPLLALMMALMVLPVYAIELPTDSMDMFGSEPTPAELEVVEDNFIVYDGVLGRTSYYVAALKNKADSLASMMQSTLKLMNEAGEVVSEQAIYSSYPQVVKPGELTYIYLNYMSVEPEVADQVTSWKLEANGEVSEWEAEVIALPSKVEMTVGSREDYFTNEPIMTVQFMTEVTNNTEELQFDINSMVLVRDAKGKLVAVDGNNTMEIGAPAGGILVLKSRLPDGLADALAAKDMTPATAESFAAYEPPFEYDY